MPQLYAMSLLSNFYRHFEFFKFTTFRKYSVIAWKVLFYIFKKSAHWPLTIYKLNLADINEAKKHKTT